MKLTGVDFSEYKRATIQRRTARRMALREKEDLEAYLRLLETDDAEAGALCEDVLIHVTSFFREPATFEAIANHILPLILSNKPNGAPLRAWVAGCSTGEEVYSLAIALLEYLEDKNRRLPLHFFGTDLDERALEIASRQLTFVTALRSRTKMVNDRLRSIGLTAPG